MSPTRGLRFRHTHRLDPGWRPGPGQKYTDGPKAVCEVTRVTATTVYFRVVMRGRVVGTPWSVSRDRFATIVGEEIPA